MSAQKRKTDFSILIISSFVYFVFLSVFISCSNEQPDQNGNNKFENDPITFNYDTLQFDVSKPGGMFIVRLIGKVY